jgi:23S rRNA pseudouridine1911/1915/1917 synthase
MTTGGQHRLEYKVEKEEEGLLRDYLLTHKQLSRKSLSSIKHAGDLRLNGSHVTVRASIKAGDIVEIVFPVEIESSSLVPEKMPLHIIYEDEDVLLIDKQAGICVHPTFSEKSGTLANGVMYYWKEKGLQRTFHAVNRLDRDTSGIVLLAQQRFSHQQLSRQQKNKQVERKYYAWVHGLIEEDQGVIEAPIGRSPDSIISREVREDGQYAKTNFQVMKRYNDYTWLEVKLETGRTHQIRVHLSYIGHPLLGDDLYGGSREKVSRQALHAFYTRFYHPQTGQEVSFNTPIPKDLELLI